MSQHLVEVVIVRDSDTSNEFTVFIDGKKVDHNHETTDVKVVLWDIDLGGDEIDREWVNDNIDTMGVLSIEPDKYVKGIVRQTASANHIEPGLEWVSAGTDEPGDQVADTQNTPDGATRAYYAIGPDGNDWSVELICTLNGEALPDLGVDLGLWTTAAFAKETAQEHEDNR